MNRFCHLQNSWSNAAGYFLIVALVATGACCAMHGQFTAHGGMPHSVSAANSFSSSRSSDCDLLQAPTALNSLSKEVQQQRQEWALGKKLATDVERHVDLITEFSMNQYVNALEQNLLKGSSLSGCFVVKILLDPEPNAYSLPGGFIYVTTGLLDQVETEGQLVAALAHETAHVTARHFTKVETQVRIWGRLALIAGPAGYALRRLLGTLLLLSFVRNKEFEADRLGLRYLTAAGYRSAEFCGLLQSVFPDAEDEAFLDRLYDTHPPTNQRIQRFRATDRTLPLIPNSYIANNREFARMKMRFAVMMGEHNP